MCSARVSCERIWCMIRVSSIIIRSSQQSPVGARANPVSPKVRLVPLEALRHAQHDHIRRQTREPCYRERSRQAGRRPYPSPMHYAARAQGADRGCADVGPLAEARSEPRASACSASLSFVSSHMRRSSRFRGSSARGSTRAPRVAHCPRRLPLVERTSRAGLRTP